MVEHKRRASSGRPLQSRHARRHDPHPPLELATGGGAGDGAGLSQGDEGLTDWEATPPVRAAYLAAGGDPERMATDIPEMVAAAARDHSEWFWRPARDRLDRQHRYMKSTGMWPPPLNWNAWPKPPDDFV